MGVMKDSLSLLTYRLPIVNDLTNYTLVIYYHENALHFQDTENLRFSRVSGGHKLFCISQRDTGA